MNERLYKLLAMACELKASDLHLTVGVPPVIRVNGNLKRVKEDHLLPSEIDEMAKSIVNEEQWQVLHQKGEIDFSFGVEELARFRVNIYTQRSSKAIAFRIISSTIPTLEELFIPEIMKKLASKSQGLILVTGPTGSGKSTTLAALIRYMNSEMQRHIITLEDPIEYLHRHQSSIINQREIGLDTNNFSVGLRAALRQDPDVILVGEMRDLETISTAITAAETGHLVLGTLHTPDAPATIDRILDVFPPNQQPQVRVQLASVLTAILAQRLLPTADRRGRRAATEILVNTPAIANLIRSEKIHQINNIMQTGRAQGMHTLEMSINELIKSQVITREAAEPYLREMGS
jgi:twitching motility protein PilT